MVWLCKRFGYQNLLINNTTKYIYMGLLKQIRNNPKYYTDLLTKRRRQNCADNQYFTRNGNGEKFIGFLLKLVGNGYTGKR